MPKTINRETLRQLRDDIDAALVAVGKRHGMLLALGRASFTEREAKFSLVAAIADNDAIAAVVNGGESAKDVKAARDYAEFCTVYGMKPEWLNSVFKWNSKALKIVGLLPNKRKNNILVEGSEGGRYIMSPDEVISHWLK